MVVQTHCPLAASLALTSILAIPPDGTVKLVAHLAQLKVYELHTNIEDFSLGGVFRNGEGNTVLLRVDMDALPVKELIALPYASSLTMRDADGNEKPVMYACGHEGTGRVERNFDRAVPTGRRVKWRQQRPWLTMDFIPRFQFPIIS